MLSGKHFEITAPNGYSIAPQMRKTRSTARTTITIFHSNQKLNSNPNHAHAVYTEDWSQLRTPRPRLANVAGVVAKAKIIKPKRYTPPRRHFQLVGNQRMGVHTAIGRHVHTPILEDNKIIENVAIGLAATMLGTSDILYLYDEAHVVLIGKNCPFPQRLCNIMLRAPL